MKPMRWNEAFVLCLIVSLTAVLVSGCGSANKEAPPEAFTGVATIGFEQCYNCHADARNPATLTKPFGDSPLGSATPVLSGISGTDQTAGPDFRLPYYGWLNGPHGNYESEVGSVLTDNAPANTGFPAYADFTDNTCQKCHDPLGEGKTIAQFFFSTGVAVLGTVDRPIIGCESCHGGGGNHWGLGPLPYERPGPTQCGACHNNSFPAGHLSFLPEGKGIVEAYKASPHAQSINSSVKDVSGSSTNIVTPCARCHTDEGARQYLLISAGTMTHDELVNALSGKPAIVNASAVQCRTCHDRHNQLIILGQKALDAGIVPGAWSDEFATCTSCHQLLDGSGNLLDNGYHSPVDKNGNTVNAFANFDEIIQDTHFDDPATPEIEGYVVDPTSSHDPLPGNTNTGTCRDCHNVHNADITINEQWAQSAHGGFILDIKSAATGSFVYSAAVTELPWTEYDFKSSASNRQPCHRCHTATGFRNLANAPATYNAENDTYVATGNQKEMLYCWGCHTDTVGDLRSPGAFYPPAYVGGTVEVTNGSTTVTGTGTNWGSDNTPVGSQFQVAGDLATYIVSSVPSASTLLLNTAYLGTTASGVNYKVTAYIFPAGRAVASSAGSLSGSFVCVSCHSGRETGEYVKSYPATLVGKNFGAFNSHYLAAGGILFRTIGYEFSGATYSNPLNFAHDTIGVSVSGTGTNGPCAGCHMQNAQSHLFLPTTRDPNTDVITGLPSSAVCAVCHGSSITPTALNTLETQYNAALAALQGTMNTQGLCWTSAYPYINIYSAGCTTTAYTAWPNKDTLGAAFNMNVLEHMPMAFVHNSVYTKRLIFDSIDFLDNGTLDGTIAATINSLTPTYITSQQAADALTFLNNGVRP